MKRRQAAAPKAGKKIALSRKRRADPYLERERARYAEPLPSREYILQMLTERGVPVSDAELEDMLGIKAHEREAFARRLSAMERDGEIMRNRRGDLCVVAKLDLIRGVVQGHPDGFGFLVRDEGGPDIFLGPAEMQEVLHGDRVVARVSGTDRRGRPEGKIVEVLQRVRTRVVGRLHSEHGAMYLIPEDKRISRDFLIPPNAHADAKVGQVVTIEILTQPSRHAQPVGRVVEVLGNYADPGLEIEIALRKHELPHAFSRDIEALCERLPAGVTEKDHAGRVDVRELPLVTIDGETAKDFDDAVYCEPLGTGRGRQKNGYRLIVAIADVSHYVRHGDALDRAALERGNSVYFPRRVIPMLPERLSNDLCSINPEVDRLAVVCDMQIDAAGDIAQYRFYPAVM
jgi:ribonuclease R